MTSLLPHRGAHLLLDRVVAHEGGRLVAEGRFTAEALAGHFPGQPVVPGVAMVEGLAQALACLGRLSGEEGRAVLTSIAGARFRGLATPPCTLTFTVEVTERRLRITTARGVVREGERLLCTATLSAALLPDEPPGAVHAEGSR